MWTREQNQALDAVQRWFREDKGTFYLAGYAGTGKTTLARHFADNVDGDVRFGAFTGKAASVLRAKGCRGATTIHALIYKPLGAARTDRMAALQADIDAELARPEAEQSPHVDKWQHELAALEKRAKLMFEKQAEAEISESDLVIVDECSMIDEIMGSDLESFGVPILYLGDPGQLPPVGGRSLLSKRRPDFVLNEIHRQAAESGIIRLAHDIRHGGGWADGDYGDVLIDDKRAFDWDAALAASQLLCGRNETRRRLNSNIRLRLGRDKLYPVKGDKLICLRNDREVGVLNGVTCMCTEDSIKARMLDLPLEYDGTQMRLECDPGPFEETYGSRMTHLKRHDIVQQFDYGYAITVHKSQGSQYRDVIVCDDKMREEDETFRRQWLYTAITRAEERVTIYR
jgi:exodeoxyribonuclease V